MGAIGWYGPLIDLSAAPSHVGDYVQLLVFVHQFHSPQRLMASNGREVLKATIQVGDNTRPYFDVSLWQKHVDSNISAGDIILLQNVKVTKFRDAMEATTVQHSSLSVLAQSHELLSSHGTEKLIEKSQMGTAMREKLKMVIAWARHTQYILLSYLDDMRQHTERPHKVEANGKSYKNWLCNKITNLRHCSSIAEVACLTESHLVTFFGNIGEVCLPCNVRKFDMGLPLKNWIFVSKRLLGQMDNEITKAFLCTGCKHCGFPMEAENKSTCYTNQTLLLPYCGNNLNHVHRIGRIYSPFLLHVWDQSGYIPVLVKNLAAQQLFGNISAESVSQSLEGFHPPNIDKGLDSTPSQVSTSQELPGSHQNTESTTDCKEDVQDGIDVQHLQEGKIRASTNVTQLMEGNQNGSKIDFSRILLIMLQTLLRKNENSPLKFQIVVHSDATKETGMRNCVFELVSFTMPLET
eukprot:Gb_13658 [translate_table: standard]